MKSFEFQKLNVVTRKFRVFRLPRKVTMINKRGNYNNWKSDLWDKTKTEMKFRINNRLEFLSPIIRKHWQLKKLKINSFVKFQKTIPSNRAKLWKFDIHTVFCSFLQGFFSSFYNTTKLRVIFENFGNVKM